MNRLARERSPYLLQHAGNPVDWYPWGEEAFERARREDKPIFLSIGYSTCHWCHVMEHESFEDAGDRRHGSIDHFVVDQGRPRGASGRRSRLHVLRAGHDRFGRLADERVPDAGAEAVLRRHLLSRRPRGGGGPGSPICSTSWPASGARIGRASRRRPPSCSQRLRGVTGTDGTSRARIGSRRLRLRWTPRSAQFEAAFDRRRGGFGDAPKFPRPSELLFLLREHARRSGAAGDPEAPLRMAADTLRAMALGGMRDHVGGGFHRYSVDGDWRVPHFEKMLYDQAQLVLAYLEAAQATGDAFYAAVAEDTLRLRPPRPDRCAAADSIRPRTPTASRPEHAGAPGAHKSEGAFYIWSDAEIGQLLGDEAEVARRRFGIDARRQRAAGSAGRVHAARTCSIPRHDRGGRRRHRPHPGPTSSTSLGRVRRGAVRPHRAHAGRGRTSTTRSSPPGTG